MGWSRLFLRPSVEGHWLVPTIRVALDVGVELRPDTLLSLLSGEHPEVEMPYHREVLFLAF